MQDGRYRHVPIVEEGRSSALCRGSISAASNSIASMRRPFFGSGFERGGRERRISDSRKAEMMQYEDRYDAGRRLAVKLVHLKNTRPVVLALPRGGVAVGFQIARALDAPLDIVLVRKIGVPWQPELAVAAVTDGAAPETFIDRDLATRLDIPADYIETETERELQEIERRRNAYCAGRPQIDIARQTAIVVDDGIATGATMRVALRAVRRHNPARLVLAVPVAPSKTLAALREEVDEVVCLQPQMALGAIGFYYRDFHQMTDAEVRDLLDRAQQAREPPATALTQGGATEQGAKAK
jgi:putative phosphoribosyl transferase